jgi:hypothetical protein
MDANRARQKIKTPLASMEKAQGRGWLVEGLKEGKEVKRTKRRKKKNSKKVVGQILR